MELESKKNNSSVQKNNEIKNKTQDSSIMD